MLNEVEPTISKDLRDLTLIETVFSLGVLMVGILEVFEPLTYGTSEIGFDPQKLLIGRLSSYKGCGNGILESGEVCDDGTLYNSNLNVCSCDPIQFSQENDESRNPTNGDFVFKDPFTGKVFSNNEITSLTKVNKSNNKRIKLEKEIGLCHFMTLCSKPSAFNDDGSLRPTVNSLILDRCLEYHKDLLPEIAIQNRTPLCSLDIDIENMIISGDLTQSCCGLLQGNNFNPSNLNNVDFNEVLDKELKNVTLIELLIVMIIISILSVAIFVSMTASIDDARKAVEDTRNFHQSLQGKLNQVITEFKSLNPTSSLADAKALEEKVEAIKREEFDKFYISRFCKLFPHFCEENNMISISSKRTLNQATTLSSTNFNFPFGILNISEKQFNSILKKANSNLGISNEKLKELQFTASKTASNCIQSLVCSNPEAVFEPNNEKIKPEFLSAAIDSCLKEVTFALALDTEKLGISLGDGKNDQCICPEQRTAKTCKTKRPDVCAEVFNPVCGCNGVTYGNKCEALKAGLRGFKKGECPKGCNTDSDCDTGQSCNTSSSETFSGVSESLDNGSNSSSNDTFAGVSGSLGSSSGGTSSSETFGGVCESLESNKDDESDCGNGVSDGNEECDFGKDNSQDGPCLLNCKKAVCGDGVVSANNFNGINEECDDGNTNDGDGCSVNCKLESSCTSDRDCDDENSCNLDRCIANICRYSVNVDSECCESDAECDSTKRCDITKKVCIAKPAKCTSDSDCNSDQFCNVFNKCFKKCTSDSECSSGNTCNKNNGKCETIVGGCKSSSECKSGELCNNEKCELQQSCTVTPKGHNCPLGQFCFQEKCWNISCLTTTDCPPVQHVCNKNICEFKP
ncbi:MAG: hypothetical protein HYZ79_05925 [Candidatus Melainabacteria bacterium]|nr:hypothetical protein [Candidatus Melainabacteria bacterium]